MCVDINIYINNELAIPRNYLLKKIREETSLFCVNHFIPLKKEPSTNIWSANKDYKDIADPGFGITLYKPDKAVYSTNVENILLNNGILIPSLAENEDFLSSLGEGYFYVVANLPPETINLDVSRDNLKNFFDNIDWKTIKAAFKHLKANIAKETLPLFLLQNLYNPEKFQDYYPVFNFDRNNSEIIISYQKDACKSNAESMLDFLNYISDNQFSRKPDFSLLQNNYEKEYGEFAALFLVDLFIIVSSIPTSHNARRYSTNAESKEYDSSILDVLFSENDSFCKKNVSIANEMYRVIQTPEGKKKYLYNEIKSLINRNKSYYNTIHRTMKSDITNMFKDNRYSAPERRKISSKDNIQKIMNKPDIIPEQLFSLFKSYLKRSYTSIVKNNKLTLTDVAAINVSAVYSLLDIASVVCSCKMLDEGVRIAIVRNKIEPTSSWFSDIE